MRAPHKRIIIIGCGIAGPAVAMFLRLAGIEATIYEARDVADDYAGAFLNLMPNGLDVLNTLGLLDELRSQGHATNCFTFTNGHGRSIGELELTGTEAYDGARSILIKRGLLHRILRVAAQQRGIQIEFGKKLVDLVMTSSGTVNARFEDGTEATGECLIGCDGVHSRTRRSILPDAPEPSYIGLMNTGSIVEVKAVVPSSTMTMTFGKKAFFGYQAVPTGEVYWFSNFPEKEPARGEGQGARGEIWKQRLLALHADDPDPIPDIIRSTEGPIGAWPTFDLPFLPSWYKGPICLAGDAAHATSPSAGSGASLALEDAIVLAKCIRDIPDLSAAFTRYEHLRKGRTERVVLQARRNDSQKLITNPLLVWLRDRLMPFFSSWGARATAQIYTYRVDWASRVE